MRALMKDNLIMNYQLCPEFNYKSRNPALYANDEANELLCIKKVHGWLDYFETKKFLKSIEGREVELRFSGPDAFEKNDNNHWLPSSLWTPI